MKILNRTVCWKNFYLVVLWDFVKMSFLQKSFSDDSSDQNLTGLVITVFSMVIYLLSSFIGYSLYLGNKLLDYIWNSVLWNFDTYLGIIHYEKFGQDPQKRSFPDRIFSFNILLVIFCSLISDTIIQIRNIFGPVGVNITLLKYYAISVLLTVPLGFAESILFKCFMVFFWKKLAMINDDFLAMFFKLFNFMVAQIISVIRMTNGDFYKGGSFRTISGMDIEADEEYLKEMR